MAFEKMQNEISISGGQVRWLGTGFQQLDGEFCTSSPFTKASRDAADSDTQSQGGAAPLGEGNHGLTISVSETQEELSRNVSVTADAHAFAWGFKFSGSAAFARNTEFTSKTLAVAITAWRDVGDRWLDPDLLELGSEPKNFLTNPSKFRNCYDKYGGYFAISYSRGGWITLLFKKECSSVEEKIDVSASIKAESAKAGGEVTATSAFASKMQSEGFEYRQYGDGHSPAPPKEFGPDKLIAWISDHWWTALTPENAAVTGMTCANLWQMPHVDPTYRDLLKAPTENMDSLTEARLQARAVEQEAAMRAEDKRLPENLRTQFAKLNADAKDAGKALDTHVDRTDPLDRQSAETVLGDLKSPADLEQEYTKLLSQIDGVTAVSNMDSFHLRTNGENEHYIARVSSSGEIIMTANKRKAAQVRFHTDGMPVNVGTSFRLAIPSSPGSKHIVQAPGKNKRLKMNSGTKPDRTWMLTGKGNDKGNSTVHYGDKIAVENKAYRDMTIKSVPDKGGKTSYATAKGFKRHYLVIEKP